MRSRKSLVMAALFVALNLLPLLALAQEDPKAKMLGGLLGTGMMGVMCCFWLVFYVYFALCIYKIAQKCGVEMAWLAWIPIVQVIPLLQAGKKPIWWIILLLIPIVNIVIGILVWMAVAEQRGKPSWLGILIIVPIANLVIPGYLAFSE